MEEWWIDLARKERAPASNRNGTATQERRDELQQELRRDRGREELSVRSQMPKLLPLKTRECISDLVIDAWNMLGAKGKVMASSKEKQVQTNRMIQGTLEVLEFKMCTTASLSERNRTCLLHH